MESQEALLAGASIGLAIAAPIGPMAIIVIRRTLAGGFLAGLTTGAGASTIHLLYATLAVCGLNQLAAYAQRNTKLLHIIVALALLVFAVRILRHRAIKPTASSPARRSLIGNYASAVAFSLVNPLSFALLLSAVAAIAGLSSTGASQTSSLAAGVFAGSIAWWTCLVGVTASIGIRISPRSTRVIDIIAGLIMFALAASTMSRII